MPPRIRRGKLDRIREDEARLDFVESDTTLLWIVKHLTKAELLWIGTRVAGREMSLPDDSINDQDTIASVVSANRAAWLDVDANSTAAPLDKPCHDIGAEAMVDLRWVLIHLLEETARHADILRELVDGTAGR